jgi:hypothetical protein
MSLVTYINTQAGAPEFHGNQMQCIRENLQFYEESKDIKTNCLYNYQNSFHGKFKKLCNSLSFFNTRCSSES